RHPEHEFVNVDALTYAANLASVQTLVGRPNYSFERVDITDRAAVGDLFERVSPNVVVHFAAESHVDRSIRTPQAFIATNVMGTFNLLEEFRSLPAQRRHLFHH